MIDGERSETKTLLSHYGEFLAQYKGTDGRLTLDQGQAMPCEFEIGQLNDGENILLCMFSEEHRADIFYHGDLAISFAGETDEGYKVTAEEGLFAINYLPDARTPEGRSGAAFTAHRMHKFRVEAPQNGTRRQLHFGLTNMRFHSYDMPWQGVPYVFNIPVDEPYGDISFSVSLVPDYDRISAALQTLNHVAVTCELSHTITGNISDEQLIELVTDICFILSVARGSMVSLAYINEYDDAGSLQVRTHLARVTKPYCPWPTVAAMEISDRGITKQFVEATYATYRRRRDDWKLNRGTIFSYLDGKVQGDFLEMRGVKLAIALEMLKAVYLDLPTADVSEFCIERATFESLYPALKSAVKGPLVAARIDGDARDNVYSIMRGSNRTTFRRVLAGLFEEIDFHPEKAEIDTFITCRDRLVHRGRFYSQVATEEECKKMKPFPRVIDEYAFMVNFLDRIFLRLLGYDGPYMDHRIPDNPIRKASVTSS